MTIHQIPGERIIVKHTRALLSVAVIAAVSACSNEATAPVGSSNLAVRNAVGGTNTGNGAPSGSHYTLNIIGTSEKNPNMTGGNGSRIFVALDGSTKINLCEAGEDANCPDEGFNVIDANGTDGSATFSLPAADTDPDNCVQTGLNTDGSPIYLCGSGITTYSVFVRALGHGGTATMTLCGTDPYDNVDVCSNSSLTLDDDSKPGKFSNETGTLLYLYGVDIDGDGDVDYRRIPLFSDVLEGYFWDYDNEGRRIVQLRFYPCSSTVGDDTPTIVSSACELTGNGR
jgi:hypothetical protein